MNPYTLGDINKIVSGKLFGNPTVRIQSLSLDSRTAVPSSSILFFCIRGLRHDGHIYVEELYNKGIKNFVFEYIPQGINLDDINYLLVDGSINSLQKLASYHRQQFKGKIIGITGSNGKTIIKEWLWQCLRKNYNAIRSPKSYNSQIGVPLSAWLLNNDAKIGILEAGISIPGEMEKLQKIISPEIGIFTNIGEAHQEGFLDFSQKIIEKSILFKDSQVLIYSKDHKTISEILKEKYPKKTHLDWSYNKNAWLTIKNIEKQTDITRIKFNCKTISEEIDIPFTDKASIENAIHVLVVLLHLNMHIEDIKKAMINLQPVAMRLELKKGINNCTVINDSYNSDLNSLDIALDFLNLQTQHSTRTLILSDILQSGKEEKDLYKEVAQKTKEKNITQFIGIGDAIYKNKNYFDADSVFFKSTQEFIEYLSSSSFKDEAILLKGSRNFQFEKIASLLEEKTHTTILEINLNAIIHNLNFYRSLITRETKIMVMLKAFSYGSGSYEIANVLQNQRVDYVGVAIADEGVTLRKNGINTPIIVMSPSIPDFDSMLAYRLEPEIHSFELLDAFKEHLTINQTFNYPIHIKIDTGMHRLGFMPEEINKLLDTIKNNKNILVKSVFSHLAASDEPEQDDFTYQQLKIFEETCKKLSSNLNNKFIRHILNTNGIERFPLYQFEMVRLGIGLYGVSNKFQNKVENVSTFKSKIVQIKNIMPGETIGYGRKGKAIKMTKIATIPIGYADGLDRKLSNGNWHFLVNGKYAPTIGNICMDLCMIDITGIEANFHDEVIVFGRDPGIVNLAEKLGTITYEVLTKVSQRVKRVYIHE